MLSVFGIILAAGLSRRMGKPKLVLKIRDQSIIYRVVRSAISSSLDGVVLVTGPTNSQVVDSLQDLSDHPKLSFVRNMNPEAGMASSMVAGMSFMTQKRDGVMIILGDQVRLSTSVVNHLVAVFSQSRDSIVAPTVSGRQTTPVIFPARFFPVLMSLSGDQGGRSILQANPDSIVRVELGDIYDDIDIDTPEDLMRLKDT